jgi:hypothetical protein
LSLLQQPFLGLVAVAIVLVVVVEMMLLLLLLMEGLRATVEKRRSV